MIKLVDEMKCKLVCMSVVDCVCIDLEIKSDEVVMLVGSGPWCMRIQSMQ